MDVASVLKSIQTLCPHLRLICISKPQRHKIIATIFHWKPFTLWQTGGVTTLLSYNPLIYSKSWLIPVYWVLGFFCQNGALLHRWPGCVLVFHHGQGLGGGHRCSNDEAMVINSSSGAPCVKPDVAWECKEWGPFSPALLYILFKCLNIWLSDSLRGIMGWSSAKAQIRAVNGWGEISETRWMCVMVPEVM